MNLNWFKNILQGRQPAQPRLATGKRIYAVGDIHGRRDLLDALLKRVVRHAEENPARENILVFLGDYVDRGPDSCGVIARLAALHEELPNWRLVFLRGNHDQAVLNFIEKPELYGIWRSFGATETLLSYGVMPPRMEKSEDFTRARDLFARKVPLEHFRFMSRLRYFHVEDDYLFVHAGIRPGLALRDQLHDDLLWIREDFLLHRGQFEKMVVHGHTPAPSPVKLANRICVDTGAHATGRLTALVLEGESQYFIDVSNRNAMPRDVRHLEAVSA